MISTFLLLHYKIVLVAIYNGRGPWVASQIIYRGIEDYKECRSSSPSYSGILWSDRETFFEMSWRLSEDIPKHKNGSPVNVFFHLFSSVIRGFWWRFRAIIMSQFSSNQFQYCGEGSFILRNYYIISFNALAKAFLLILQAALANYPIDEIRRMLIDETYCRNGYAEAESDRLCSQYKFRPSDKYVPMMPLNVNKWIWNPERKAALGKIGKRKRIDGQYAAHWPYHLFHIELPSSLSRVHVPFLEIKLII